MRIILGIMVLALALSLWLFFSRQQPAAPTQSEEKILVVASIFPLADWLREIGGSEVEVHCLVSGGANPHHFEPSIKDVSLLNRAKAIFVVGLQLDPWAEKLAANTGRREELELFVTSKWITPRHIGATKSIEIQAHQLSADEHGHDGDKHHHSGNEDPHYWLDPARAASVVKHMGEELGRIDPPHRELYAQRAVLYQEKLGDLSREIEQALRMIPAGSKLVTFHDAYGYLLDRLGVTLAAVIQASPGVEPSLRDMSEGIQIMRDIRQSNVFYEPASSMTEATMVAHELNIPLVLLDPMDTEMSEAGKSYLERERHNIHVLIDALAVR